MSNSKFMKATLIIVAISLASCISDPYEQCMKEEKRKNAYLGEQINVLGNHLGIWDIAITKNYKSTKYKFYFQHPFEDKSGAFQYFFDELKQLKISTNSFDGLFGFEVNIEDKKCEFEKAKFGIIGLETVFPIINTVLKDKIELSRIIDLISRNPRNILGLKTPKLEENEYANMTLFNPTEKWTYQKSDIASLSKNTPFIGCDFIGRPIGVINNSKIQINS